MTGRHHVVDRPAFSCFFIVPPLLKSSFSEAIDRFSLLSCFHEGEASLLAEPIGIGEVLCESAGLIVHLHRHRGLGSKRYGIDQAGETVG